MPIPDFQTLMHPLLRLMSDRREKSVRETSDLLVEELRVTPEELAILRPSGQSVFRNRVGWAKTYLSKAGLLASTRRGYFSITDRGIEVLAQAPNRIDIRFLEQFPEFVGFRERAIQTEPEDAAAISKQDSEQTPDEALDQAYARIHRELADQVLTAVKTGSSRFFEDMVVKLLLAMGYGGSRLDAGKSLGRPGDEGIDGLINEDKLGLDAIYVQAKKWEGTVGRPEIKKFVGALHGKRAKKGVFITTGNFSDEAREYVSHIDPKIALLDGQTLANLMIENDLGVATKSRYEVKQLDRDFFDEE